MKVLKESGNCEMYGREKMPYMSRQLKSHTNQPSACTGTFSSQNPGRTRGSNILSIPFRSISKSRAALYSSEHRSPASG